LLVCFLVLVFYLGYVNIILGPVLAFDPHNRRLAIFEKNIQRGHIYDRQGVILAQTVENNGVKHRVYPMGYSHSQVVGFISQRFGRTGLESAYDRYLLGLNKEQKISAGLSRLLGRIWTGNDVVTTLDSRLQKKASELLDGHKGAVVVLDPETGEILVLVSSPSYDPNNLEEQVKQPSTGQLLTNYELIQKDKSSPLLNRTTMGAYPPGSTFKVVTAAGALTANPDIINRTFKCTGSIEIKGFQLKDTTAYGEIDFLRALAVSCNVTFAGLGLQLGPEKFYQTALGFGLTEDPWERNPLKEVQYFPGNLSAPSSMSKTELASAAIGQGKLLVSPLQMALVAAAIANDGIIMRPHLLKEVRSPEGKIIKKATSVWKTASSLTVARKIKNGMKAVVEKGTGRSAALPGIEVAGKTGSAQNPHGNTHSWFIGFTPAGAPKIALAVIAGNAGGGAAVAAPIVPIVKEIFREYFNNGH